MFSEKEIKTFILRFLEKKAKRFGIKEKFLLNDFELIKSGLLDSMSFLDLITAIEANFKIQIDFDDKNPSEFTTLTGLIKLVSEAKKI